MLCSNPAYSLGCELPASHGNLKSFTRWSQMERVSIVTGQVEKTEATAAVHGLLQQTFQLFSTSGSSAGRDESLLDRFLAGLDQQLEELDSCLREGRSTEQSTRANENSRLAGKSYFQNSCCAWEVVSVEIRRSLVLANKLIGKLRK
ncbi:hypothetical protein FD755_019700 [Muntiacus reevesi]|uniref:Uncharacterized protein n=1 Tax=Muntiacus reevesi TaxID=9886 RepID=A0A5N3X6B4_MUNRE|nr:hypothetical protein FD755_019700 [Muntiacus reevesi]